MTRHSVHIKVDGRTYAGAYTVDRKVLTVTTSYGKLRRWATKSRMRPWLISSCMSWCKRRRAGRAHDGSNQLVRMAVALRDEVRRATH